MRFKKNIAQKMKPKRTKLFFDTEFTGLHQHTSLISMAFVAEEQRTFYAEFTDFDTSAISEWLETTVLAHLHGGETNLADDAAWFVRGDKATVTTHLRTWLARFEAVEIWADVLAYDWVLFCELFGGAFGIPNNVYYIPFDLATLLRLSDLEDVKRQDFAADYLPNLPLGTQHNALWDAWVAKACWEKIENFNKIQKIR